MHRSPTDADADFIVPAARDPYPRGQVIGADDPRAMVGAIVRLSRLKIRFRRVSPHHLKVGRFNFYPTTGTIMADGEMPRRNCTLEDFIARIQASSVRGDASIRHPHPPRDVHSPVPRLRLAVDNTEA